MANRSGGDLRLSLSAQLTHPPPQVGPGTVLIDLLEEAPAAGGEEAADTPGGLWLVTGDQEEVPLASLLEVLPHEYSQRVDPDRVRNPHGEHAEEIFALLVELRPGVHRGGA